MKSPFLIFLMLLAPFFLNLSQEKPKGATLKQIYQKGRWGYADTKGKIVIEPRFDAALPFSAGLARVGVVDEELPEIDGRPNMLWGYIDEMGHVIVALRYNFLRGFSEGLAAAAVMDPALADASVFRSRGWNNLVWGYVDREGRVVIPTKFLAAGDFSEGLAAVDAGGERDSMCGGPRQYGYLDKTGAFVIKPRFAHAGPFQNGHAQVAVGYTRFEGRCACCNPRFVGQHGLVDPKGVFVVDEKSKGDSLVDPEVDPDHSEVPR